MPEARGHNDRQEEQSQEELDIRHPVEHHERRLADDEIRRGPEDREGTPQVA